MRELPSGKVTFLFTDIEGSTKLLDVLGEDGYDHALSEHRSKLREVFARYGGIEVDTQGDAFFFAFAEPVAAVAAASEAQLALTDGPIRVRMGLHTGEARRTQEGYVGREVHRGARIAAAGHGGQVLLSKPTRDLVDVPLTDLGEHHLKDFGAPVWIYQLGADHFPPLKTISNTNLPRPASSFVGREQEVDDVSALLRDGARLVTLTGPGGTGKTRLAIETAADLVPEYRNGVFWVDLAALRDPTLVPDTIGQTLGAKDGLTEHIQERELLLVLDNLEQVIDAAPALAGLVESCPNLRVLVTSRELLRVRGEVEYAVPPLADPEAAALFSARSGIATDSSIEELCLRLENLPLAVELAAARASVLSPRQILDRLSSRLDLLKGGRDADPRQMTLRAAIEWSYDLLADDEKRLFARLAVFRAGCTLEAAERVVEANLDGLQSLVDKSLLRHADERFSMLETIREYAAERLEASGEAYDLQRRHAEFFLELAEEAEPYLRDVQPAAWLERLGPESDNFRAALDRLEASGNAEGTLRLAGALDEFWCPRSEYSEGRRYLAAALRMTNRTEPERAKALIAAAHLARDDGDPAAGRNLAEEAVAMNRTVGDRRGGGRAVLWLGACFADEREFERARQLFEEAARLSTDAGDDVNALFANRLLAWMYYELGDKSQARILHEANLVRARELGWRDLEASILGALSEYAIDDGRFADALVFVTAGIRISLEDRNRPGLAVDLCKAASTLVHVAHADTAIALLASAGAWYEGIGSRPLPYLDELVQQTISLSRVSVGQEAFERAWEAGRTLPIEKAAALALDALVMSGAQQSMPSDDLATGS